ncbi:MAG: DUF5606 domain-containing protein [Bacteroidota bacterium]
MDLKEILSVTGRPGLYKIIAHTKSGLIVESLIDKKRIPVYSTDKMVNMEDISIFTADKDVALKDIFKLIHEKENGEKTIDHKSDDKKLREYFEQILPDYDKDRVYVSDIKKVYNWYNLLVEHKFLDFNEPAEEAVVEAVDEKEKPKPEKTAKTKEEKPKADKPKKTVKAKKETETDKKPTAKK